MSNRSDMPPPAPSTTTNQQASLINIDDYHKHARHVLPRQVYDYYRSGAHDEITLKDNVEAFNRLKLRPRVLVDVSRITIATTILGHRVKSPIAAAPSAMQKMAHDDGESGNARACAKKGSIFCLSSLSTTSLEQVAQDAPDSMRWFQLYVYRDRAVTESLVKRVENAGYTALVLTVDTPQLGVRERDVRNRFRVPSHLTMANFTNTDYGNQNKVAADAKGASGVAAYAGSLFDRSLSWKDLAWLKSITSLPIVVKGVLTHEDAKLAVEHGASAIVVSNHGARQLDGVPATIESLPEVVAACKGTNVEVYMDGGIRRGTDVFKALALGARAVFLGRPILWGLTYAGQEGVEQVLTILNNELELAMSLAGCSSIDAITRERLTSDYTLRPKL